MNFEEIIDLYDYNKKTCIVIFSENDKNANMFIENIDELSQNYNVRIYEHNYTKKWVPNLRVFFVVKNNKNDDINVIINKLKKMNYIVFPSFRNKKNGISMYIFGEIYVYSNIDKVYDVLNMFPSDEENSYIVYSNNTLQDISSILSNNLVDYEWSICAKINSDLTERYLTKHWYLNNSLININMFEAWEKIKKYTSKRKGRNDIGVAIYDDGFDISHCSIYHKNNVLFLKECNFHNEMEGKYNYFRGDNNPTARPYDTHGTRVASLCLGNYNILGVTGIAPDVKFIPMAIRFYIHDIKTDRRVNFQVSNHDIVGYFHEEVLRHAHVISCSWTFYFKLPRLSYKYIENVSRKTVFVVSAGNKSIDITNEHYSFYDLGRKNVIIVGSVNKYGLPTTYTNYGEQVLIYAPAGSSCNIFDPYKRYYAATTVKSDITKINDFNKYISESKVHFSRTDSTDGTSFSTPIVSGAVALIKSIISTLDPNTIKKILYKTGTPMREIYNNLKKSNEKFINEFEKYSKKISKNYNIEKILSINNPKIINVSAAIDAVIKIRKAFDMEQITHNVQKIKICKLLIYIDDKLINIVNNASINKIYKIRIISKSYTNINITFEWINVKKSKKVSYKYNLEKGISIISHKY